MKKILLTYTIILFLSSFTTLSYATENNTTHSTQTTPSKTAVAVFAGGCFWCMQPPYDKTLGVIKTVAGYAGGHTKNPTYEQVSQDTTGHYEVVEVIYNPAIVSYKKLLAIYWRNVDPTDVGGQFCDRGNSYRTAIFYTNEKQKQLAIASKQALIDSKRFKKVVTPILPLKRFYPAETYHQNYYKKNPLRYKFYRYTCGRDARLKQLWGKD